MYVVLRLSNGLSLLTIVKIPLESHPRLERLLSWFSFSSLSLCRFTHAVLPLMPFSSGALTDHRAVLLLCLLPLPSLEVITVVEHQ